MLCINANCVRYQLGLIEIPRLKHFECGKWWGDDSQHFNTTPEGKESRAQAEAQPLRVGQYENLGTSREKREEKVT